MDDEVFRALADPSRRRLLDLLNARNGQTLRELCAELDMARQSVSKHLAVLESANLVTTVWRGREKLHHLNAEPINAIADRWIHQYDRRRVQLFADLKTSLEAQTTMNDFVYTTYIKTTPERLWQALTDPKFTEQYWQVQFETDWKPGSPMIWHHSGGVDTSGPEQVVVEHTPYTRLAYRWHYITPEWAKAVGIDAGTAETIAREPLSTATFELEPVDGQVKLTVTHSGFEPDSVIRTMIEDGWPRVFADIKSFVETAPELAD
jgi:DNA-binding transcriptional ArsR family regulator/uncharacterized protein YndB with AHSA1/START domain